MALSPSVLVEVSGARGASFGDTARSVGSIAGIPIPPDSSDAEVLALLSSQFAQIVAAAPYTVIAEVKTAAASNVTISNPGTALFDGYTASNGDRILLAKQTAGAQNGIYVFNGSGSAMTRATDFDQTSEVVTGSFVRVMNGDTMAGAWVLVTTGTIAVGTTAQVWNRFDIDALAILRRSAGASNVGYLPPGTGAVGSTTETKLRRLFINPEDFGAVGYSSAAAALAGTDSTAAMQAAATAAAAAGLIVDGNARWYKTGTVSWPSGTRCANLRLIAKNSSTDIQPFLIDGRSAPKSDLIFIDIEVDGNRIGQTGLSSSGGDGQRHGIFVQGRVSGVKLVRPKAWYCATEGIAIYHDGSGAVTPSDVNDLFFGGIEITDPDCQWNGRHGGSAESFDGLYIRGGKLKNNGKNMPGYPASPYTSGGNARTSTGLLSGPLYGRAWDCESYLLGTRYKNATFLDVDCRGNSGGSLLFYHRYHTGQSDTCENVRVNGCKLEDQNGGIGDASASFFVLDDATGLPYAGSDKVFIGVNVDSNSWERQGLVIASADYVSAVGGFANIYGPLDGYASVGGLGDHVCLAIPSNINAIVGYALPFSVTGTTQIVGAGWTVANTALAFQYFLPDGRVRVKLTADVTPDAAELGLIDFTLTTAWDRITDITATVLNNVTGDPFAPIAGNSGTAANKVTFGFKAAAANLHKLTAYMTVGR